MPDKINSRCGGSCIRCWRNKLKHGNKLKKKNFPKQNIWAINQPYPKSRVIYGDSSDEEEGYESNIEEYALMKIKTEDDYSKYDIEYKKVVLDKYKIIDIYENYNDWLSENKQLFEPNIKKFTKEFSQYVPCKNNICDIKLI